MRGRDWMRTFASKSYGRIEVGSATLYPGSNIVTRFIISALESKAAANITPKLEQMAVEEPLVTQQLRFGDFRENLKPLLQHLLTWRESLLRARHAEFKSGPDGAPAPPFKPLTLTDNTLVELKYDSMFATLEIKTDAIPALYFNPPPISYPAPYRWEVGQRPEWRPHIVRLNQRLLSSQ